MNLLTFNIDFSGSPRLGFAGLYTASSWMADMFTRSGVQVYDLSLGQDRLAHAASVSLREAMNLLTTGQIDAIYTQYIQPRTPFELAAMAWPRVVPIVSVCHDFVNSMESVQPWIQSPSRHVADLCIVSSCAGATALSEICQCCNTPYLLPDITVIPLGSNRVDGLLYSEGTTRRTDSDSKDVVYLWIGRFSETYKADLRPLLLAIRHLSKAGLGFRPQLVAIGADSTGAVERLRSFSHELGISRLCRWLPNASESQVNSWLENADVLVNVSEHIQETFGLVNIEAMAAGLPVIASDWSGFREIIEHGKTGLLIPTSLSVDMLTAVNLDLYGGFSSAVSVDVRAMVEAMSILGRNLSLRLHMGELGKKRVQEKYTTEVLAREYIGTIERRAEMAKNAAPRRSSRRWMCRAFSHYASKCVTDTDGFVMGCTDIADALKIVDNIELRREMCKVLENIKNGGCSSLGFELCSNVPLRNMATNLLLKLGVVETAICHMDGDHIN